MARKPNEKVMIDKIRAIQKGNQANKRCADCQEMGPTYICLNFQTFVCQTCSGIHREFGHKMKGISLSQWTKAEVEDIEKGGNERAADIWLARWSRQECPEPDSSQPDKVRQFLRQKYVEKRWYRAPGEDRDDDRRDRRDREKPDKREDRREEKRDEKREGDRDRDRREGDRDRRDGERDRESDRRDDRDRKDRDRDGDRDRQDKDRRDRRDRDEDDGRRERDRRDTDRRRDRELREVQGRDDSDDDRDRRDRRGDRRDRDDDRDRENRDRRDNERDGGRRRERELKEGSRGFYDESDDDRDRRDRDRRDRDRSEKEAPPPPSAAVDFFDPDKPSPSSNTPAPSANPFGGSGDWADFASAKPQAPPAPSQPSGGLFDLDFSSGGGSSSGLAPAPTTSPTGNNLLGVDLASGNSSGTSANLLAAPPPSDADRFAALQGNLGNLFSQPQPSPFSHLPPPTMGQQGMPGAMPGMPGASPPGPSPVPQSSQLDGSQQQMPPEMQGQMPQMMPGGGMPMMTPQQMQNMNPQQLAQMQMMLQAQMQMMMQMQMQMQPGMQQPGGYPGQQAVPGSKPPEAGLFNDLSAEFQQKASFGDTGNSGQMGATSTTAKPTGGSPFDMFG